jgi:lantibiotic transport system permease protein
MFSQSFFAEIYKSKRSFAVWITILGALLTPVTCFLIEFINWRYFIPHNSENPWIGFVNLNISISSGLLFPFLVILMVAFNLNLEYKADSWKKMYVLPVRKETLFCSKLFYLIFQLFICSFLFFISMLFSGLLLGFLRPELSLSYYNPDIALLLNLFIQFFISLLGILSIQLFLCIVFANIIIPVTFGTICLIITLVISTGWKYSLFEPYAFPILMANDLKNEIVIPLWFGFKMTQVLSVIYFFVFSVIGLISYKTKKIR